MEKLNTTPNWGRAALRKLLVAASVGVLGAFATTSWAYDTNTSHTLTLPAVTPDSVSTSVKPAGTISPDTTRTARTSAVSPATDTPPANAARNNQVAGLDQFQQGRASWYGPGFHNRLTANGERFNMNAMTAAHKTLPFGTMVLVKSARSGKSVVVRINDRGPYAHGRVIDLSKAAAQELGMHNKSVYNVILYRMPKNGKGKPELIN